MNYKKKYKRQRERNKSLMDRIDDLKLEISEMNNTKSESMERIQNLIDELETIRQEFLLVMDDLDRCKENYNMLRKLIVQNKRIMIFGLKITDLYLNIKNKFGKNAVASSSSANVSSSFNGNTESYHSTTSALMISYIASYAVISRFVRSDDGTSL